MWKSSESKHHDDITKMCMGLYQEDPGPRPVPESQIRRTLQLFSESPARGRALVLELEGKACGYALLASFWSNEVGGEICTLDEFYVSPSVRGKGHGRALLRELTANKGHLWPSEAKAFDLEVTPGNPRAKEFYASFGFKPAKNTHMRLRF